MIIHFISLKKYSKTDLQKGKFYHTKMIFVFKTNLFLIELATNTKQKILSPPLRIEKSCSQLIISFKFSSSMLNSKEFCLPNRIVFCKYFGYY